MRNHSRESLMSNPKSVRISLVVMAALLGAAAPARTPAVDVVVYGDHVPTKFHDGTTFQSPFSLQWEPGDPITEVGFQAAPGVRNPLGTFQWGHTAFGKYILSGTYGAAFLSAALNVEDLLINIFDSEEKDACSLDVTGPGQTASKTTRTLTTANPNGRQSRIFMGGQGYAGFILADLDNANPCTWSTVEIPGAGNGDPDGLAVLWHEDEPGFPFGRDYVVIPSWWGGTQTVYRVDSGGVQTVATYLLPRLARPGQCTPPSPPENRPCFEVTCPTSICVVPDQCEVRGFPVQVPQVDRTRPKNDVRWTSSMELYFHKITPPGGCGGYVAVQEYRIDLTAATPTIVPTSPVFQAGALGEGADASVFVRSDPHPLSTSHDSQGGLWKTLWRRKTVPSGGAFYPTVDGVFATKTTGQQCVVNQQTVIVGNPGSPVPAGEHCYYNPARANDMSRVNADQLIKFDHSVTDFGNLPNVQVGNAMYIVGPESMQRAQLSGTSWVLDPPTTYKVALPYSMLPAEPRHCADASNYCECPAGTPPTQSCQDVAHCGSGNLCVPRPESDFSDGGRKVLIAGGAPTSLWTPQVLLPTGTAPSPMPRNNLYWNRIPITSKPAEGLTGTMRPSIAWAGDRLWLVTRHTGVNKFRVREDGVWSKWVALPAGPVDTQPQVVTDGTSLEIVAPGTGSSPELYTLRLTSALNCAVGACTWSAWTTSTIGAKTTPSTPAASYDPAGNLNVAIRGTDNLLYYGRRPGNCDGVPWTQLGTFPLTEPPAVVWHPTDNRLWVAMRDSQAGLVRVAKFLPGSAPTWEVVSGGLPAAQGKGPALAWDGTRMRLLTTDNSGAVYQSAHDGSAWTSWQRVPSGTFSDVPPGAAVVNGEVNLMTREALTLSEALVPVP